MSQLRTMLKCGQRKLSASINPASMQSGCYIGVSLLYHYSVLIFIIFGFFYCVPIIFLIRISIGCCLGGYKIKHHFRWYFDANNIIITAFNMQPKYLTSPLHPFLNDRKNCFSSIPDDSSYGTCLKFIFSCDHFCVALVSYWLFVSRLYKYNYERVKVLCGASRLCL